MNVKKFPNPDPNFYNKIRGAARTDYERGMVYILQHTGMHISNLVSLKEDNYENVGVRVSMITWRRVKNKKPMRAPIPKGDRDVCLRWIQKFGNNKRSTRAIQYKLKAIGDRAGIPGLSQMSFRAQFAVTMLDAGEPAHEVCHMLGCSKETLDNHYAQIKQARRVLELMREEDPDDEQIPF